MLRVQLGKLYHQYVSHVDKGILVDDENLLKFTELLRNKFDTIKNLTKARLRKKKSSKSGKPRENKKIIKRRKMLNRKYLRV